MHQRKSKKILVYFFLLITISTVNNISLNNSKFSQIQNIEILGLDTKNEQLLLNKVKNLKTENIFLINKDQIIKIISSNSLIEKYVVIKNYPSSISIIVEKTKFFAKIINNGKTFLIGSNGKLTPAYKPYNELPYIFGNPNIKEFLNFKEIIDRSQFSYNQIDNLYFFPSNRWDLRLKDNILLKLPKNFTDKTLNRLHDFLENYNKSNFTVVDNRIENQIILNE